MAVNLRQHRPVGVAQQGADRQGVHPRLEHTGREAVAEVVQAPFGPVLPGEFRDLLTTAADGLLVCGLGLRIATLDPVDSLDLGRQWSELLDALATLGETQPAEPAVQSVRMPGPAAGVAKQRPLGMSHHQPPSDLDRPIGEVDESVSLLALGLVGWEDPSPTVEVDVACFDGEDLLGAATGLPADNQQVSEFLVPDLAEDPGVLLGCDDDVPPAGSGLLDVANGTGTDQPHLRRPVECPLHSRDRAPLAAAPAGLGVDPLLDVD